MQESVFYNELERMADSVGARVSDDRKEVYWQELRHIPDEAWKHICRMVVKRGERFPLIKQLIDMWNEWKREHPGRMRSQTVKSDCPDCYGEGTITYYLTNPKYKHYDRRTGKSFLMPMDKIARCARCRNAMGHPGMPVKTREQIEEGGGVVTNPPRQFWDNPPIEFNPRRMRELIDRIKGFTEEENFDDRKQKLNYQAEQLRQEEIPF